MLNLPLVGRIEGAALEARGAPDQMVVLVQYSSHKGELCEFEMAFDEAMRLLNALRQIEKDSQRPPMKS